MKKLSLLTLTAVLLFSGKSFAQEEQDRVITTAVPFLMIAADARAAGMGDQGVATPADAFSQQWNPAKYVFIESQQGFGVTYTPYLSELVNDIFLGNITYYNRISERSAFGASFKYFSMGNIEARENPEELPLILSPNEFTLDLSYSLRLSERFSMAVAGRFLRSDLKLAPVDPDATAASTFGVDVTAYYQSDRIDFTTFDGRWRAGAAISNIGPKIKYDEGGQENFIPTNLKLGGGFDFILDNSNRIGTYLEFNKLLVPTPQDFDLDGDIDAEDNLEYNSIGAIEGMFKSFGDAPDGFAEEVKEITYALGAEYVFQDIFSLRTGYFHESPEKGSREFISFGAGFKYTVVNIDISYLFSTSDVVSPLEGTLRFGLTFNFGNTYDEY
ncbi:MAG: type IX secretion system outer membrane channel protein PorV [Salinimicrobium sediminis]|uniref:Long-chain fatty acid transport protein n=1 Tax=Salinimicrobium sediminis TaxID=1343891 RepID=A0A285X5S4_9FLAO|nr:type IX secretion system outer membrane channel protein PorV [Salinimicrobium sediminis]MDX1602457.1 type IX secretion system outer membrane channel protein PorV [Salinimicrobium sediminis]MDX1752547.1 type IX secretion system outer membrane channel protein PorV [Salinimicrobium sediminis]SOC80687.1 Long-chain fatty acid transport protein [Salinimicrobium sediminis]